jgi:4-hydroxy-3-methylbut-2-en-1-yl diphosphate synthase IspG/GcpE
MGVNMLPLSIMHCHHEPKEKPKCWCEINDQYLYRINKRIVGVEALFCPECGRELERKEVRQDEG